VRVHRQARGNIDNDLVVGFFLAAVLCIGLMLIMGVWAFSSTSSAAERACLDYGAPKNAIYKRSEPYSYVKGGFIVSYTVPEKRGIQRVGCVRTNGDFDAAKSAVMFDDYALPLQAKCLAEKVSLAPAGTHARMRHVYGYRDAAEMEMLSRYEKFCTIERMRQQVLDEAR